MFFNFNKKSIQPNLIIPVTRRVEHLKGFPRKRVQTLGCYTFLVANSKK